MLPPEALEGAFGEGATMLQIILLLGTNCWGYWPWEGGENDDGGRGNWVKGWGGSQFTLVAWPTENLFPPRSGPRNTVYSLHAVLWVAILGVRRIERRVVRIKRHQWVLHHNCWNQSHVIDLERTQHYWIQCRRMWGSRAQTPPSLALTLICVRQVHHPVLPQVPVNGCRYTGLAGRQGLEGESMRGW